MSTAVKQPIRCAIYTRKSTSEGLDQDFTSLDAQREAAQHFIRSQQAEGWSALPETYDDGGFTGANVEIFGEIVGDNALSLCNSMMYYVNQLADETSSRSKPDPLNVGGRESDDPATVTHTVTQ